MLPSSTWEKNLRHLLDDDSWDKLRRFCYKAAGNTCIACGSRGEPHVECHESWRFDEETGVQHLTGLLCLCPTCHKVKHLGYANRIGRLGDVYDRLYWLNDWTPETLKANLNLVSTRQETLSKREWTLDISFLQKYGVR